MMPTVPGETSDSEWLAERKATPSPVAPMAPAPAMPSSMPAVDEQSDTDWMANRQIEERARLKTSVQQGMERSPDQAARILRLQMKTGFAEDLIAGNLDEIEREAKTSGFDPDKFRKSSPVVAKWLAENPNHPSIAAEEISKLNYLERQWRNIKDRFHRGGKTTELSDIGQSAWIGTVTPEQRKRQGELEKELATDNDYGISGFFETIPGAVAEQLPIFGKSLAGKVKFAGAGGAGGAAIGAGTALVAGQLGPQVATPEEVVTVPAAAIAAGTKGAYLGWRYGGAIEAARIEGGLAYLEFEKLKDDSGVPLDPITAKGAAAIVGAVNGGLEMVGLESIGKNMPGVRALGRDGVKKLLMNRTTRQAFLAYAKNIGQAVGGEGATEAMQEIVKDLGGTLATAWQNGTLPNLSADAILASLTAAGKAGIEGAKAGGGTSAVVGTASVAVDVARAKNAQATKETFVNIGNGIRDSKLMERMPEKMQEIAARLAENGDTKTVFIPVDSWNTYWQSQKDDAGAPIDAGTAAEEVLGNREAYDEAVTTGGDIAIPIERYAATIAATDHNNFFVDELRADPMEMNAREAKEYFQNLDKEEAAQIEADNQQEQEKKPDSADQVGGQVRGMLEKTGLFSAPQIEKYTTLLTERTRRRADVRGQDPLEMMKELPLLIQSLKEPQGQTTAAQGDLFQESKPAPTFFSKLERTIEEKMGNAATVDQVQAIVRDMKAEEREWSGVDEFLKGKTKVSKEELLAHVRGNQVEIKEVAKGDARHNSETSTIRGEVERLGETLDGMDREEDPELYQRISDELDDANIRLNDAEDSAPGDGTKFSQYTLPGGENYREVLFTLPAKPEADLDGVAQKLYSKPYDQLTNKEKAAAQRELFQGEKPEYRSSHFDESNVLAHVRLNDRVDADGKKVLFIEEVQSDWHQEGRKKGYGTDERAVKEWEALGGKMARGEATAQDEARWEELGGEKPPTSAVPNAPFKKTWHEFVLKRVIREAAEKGYDRIAWTTGEQQAERYDLSKQVARIAAHKNKDGSFTIQADKGDGELQNIADNISADKLSDVVGKDLAEKISGQEGGHQTYSGGDLKVGGEGMKGFYDKMIPSFLNKFGKKYGAKVGETKVKTLSNKAIGAPKDLSKLPGAQTKVHSLDITPALKDAALNQGFELFQEGETDTKPARGSINISDAGDIINLFTGKQNLSTFLHESGHRWLHEVGVDVDYLKGKDPASLNDIQKGFLGDADTVLQFLGVASFGEIQREHHEKWARATEAYLRDGNAPSAALRKAFSAFKRWLTRIYQQVAQLDVELNPEIRGVMDRLLATEEEIAAAQRDQKVAPLFVDPKSAGMSDEVAAKYNQGVGEAKMAAEEHFANKLISEWQREEQSWWKEQLEKIRSDTAEEVRSRPVYRALLALRKGKAPDGTPLPDGKVRLSKQAILEQYGKERLEKLKGLYAVKDGVHPDAVAEGFGFTSGDELLRAVESAEDMDVLIDRLADEKMKELHGDMVSDPEVMKAEAVAAVYNDKRAEMLRFEIEYLASNKLPVVKDLIRRVTKRVPPVKEVRAWAQAQIGAKKVKDIRPHVYQRAAAKAAGEAGKFLAQGDINSALEAKLREERNVALYRESLAAKEKVEKIEDYIKAAQKVTRRQRLGKISQEWLGQFETILNRFGMREIAVPKSVSIAEWLEQVQEKYGEEIAVAPIVLEESQRAPYSELALEDLVGIYETLKSIEHVARKITEVKRADRVMEFTDAVDELVGRIHESLPKERPLAETDKVYSEAQSVFEKTKGFLASNLRPEKILERLDGATKGVFHDLFWNPAVDAQVRRDDLRMKVMEPLREYTDKMPKGRQARMNERIFINGFQKSLHRRTIIGIALNVGNASNKAKLMEGGMYFGETHVQFDQSTLDEILNHLDEQDWQMIQKIWDSVDVLYPELNELNMRATGLPLERIEATPTQTKFGELRGGYWPAVGDPRHTQVGEKQENSESMITEIFGPKFQKAATLHSFRKVRTGAAYPLQLDWQRVLASHVDKAITDIAYHEWIKQTRRLLENQAVKKAIQNRMGEQVYRGLEEWLLHQVRPVNGGYQANQDIEGLQNGLISGTAVFALGFNAVTALGNAVLAPVQASHQIRPDHIVRGITKFLSNPKKAIEAVNQLSGEMRHRALNLDQTYGQVMRRLEGKDTYKAQLAYWSMTIHQAVDKATSTALWLGKYQQEIDAGSTPEQAMRAADKTIRTTQTAGGAKDLSSFERDPRYRMFKLFIGPMIIMQNEMRGAVAGKGVKALVDPKVYSTMMATWIIPSVLYDLVVGRGPDKDDDEWAWAMRKILLYPAMTMPYVRDAAAAIEQSLGGKRANVRSNPITDVITGLWRATDKAFDEDASTGQRVEATIRAVGPVLGVPASFPIKAVKLLTEEEP